MCTPTLIPIGTVTREFVAETLIHELAHEYGVGNEEGAAWEAEAIGQLCVS